MDDLIENFDTINNLNEIVEANTSAQELYSAANKINHVRKEQRGGFVSLTDILIFVPKLVWELLLYILKALLYQFDPRFIFTKKSNKGGFWKFVWFALKCGFFLCIFAIAGPIFMLIGITMIYGKLFKKMNEDPNESVIDFAYRKKGEIQI